MDIGKILLQARDDQAIVGIQRSRSDQLIGFVTAVNDSFVLLQECLNGIQIDGFHVVPIDHICAMEIPYSHEYFAKQALAKSGDVPSGVDIDLQRWRTVIESTRSEFPIGRYEVRSAENEFFSERVCGRVITIDDRIVVLRDISEGGIWEKGQVFLSLAELTRYSFGGRRDMLLAEFAREHTPVGPRLSFDRPAVETQGGDPPR